MRQIQKILQKAEKRKQEDLVKFFDAQLQIRNDNQAAIFAQYDADTQAQIKKINRDASLDREAKKEARKRIREENAQKKKLYQESGCLLMLLIFQLAALLVKLLLFFVENTNQHSLHTLTQVIML